MAALFMSNFLYVDAVLGMLLVIARLESNADTQICWSGLSKDCTVNLVRAQYLHPNKLCSFKIRQANGMSSLFIIQRTHLGS